MKYSNRIAKVRKAKGWSQTTLADEIGATLSMVGKLERGERKLTSAWLDKLSLSLRCRPADLLDAEDDAIPAGEVHPGGIVEIADAGAGIPEMEGITWGEGAFDPNETSLRSLAVAKQPITVTVPVGAELIYDVLRGPLFEIKIGVLCVILLRPGVGPAATIAGIVMQGGAPDRYHIAPLGGGYIENAEVFGTFEITEIRLVAH